jgi:hypothetical protein
MNLAQAIHARWAANERLNGLLPADRLITGQVPDDDRRTALATLLITGGRLLGCANDGSSVDELTVRLRVYHPDYDAGSTIVDALLAVFERADFDLAGGRVVNMQRGGLAQEIQDPHSGRWQWMIEFQCCVQLFSGA